MLGAVKRTRCWRSNLVVTVFIVLLSSSNAFSAPDLITGTDLQDVAAGGTGSAECCGDLSCSGHEGGAQGTKPQPGYDLASTNDETASWVQATDFTCWKRRQQAQDGTDWPGTWSAMPSQASATTEGWPPIDASLSDDPNALPDIAYLVVVMMMLVASIGLATLVVGVTSHRRHTLPNGVGRAAKLTMTQRPASRWSPGRG